MGRMIARQPMDHRELCPASPTHLVLATFGAAYLLAVFPLSATPPEATTAPASRPDSAAFLIVAPEGFHDALRDFLAFKQHDVRSELVSLERVLRDTAGADDPERLKRFLYSAWKTRGARYALLVGDADVLPIRYMVLDRVTAQAFDYAFYPSDLYYADLAKADGRFEDWNGRKDGFHHRYYGEVRGEKNKNDPINFDQIHYLPEIAVGRWPVSSLPEVTVVARKSIAYERSLRHTAQDARHVAAIVVGGWVDVRDRMNQIIARLPDGWMIDKRYYADEGQPASTPPPTEANVLTLLNDGVRLVLHAGHGGDDEWSGCLSVRSLAQLRNADHLPIMLSAGCSTARFATLPPYEGYLDVEGRTHAGSNNGEVFGEPPPPPAPYQAGPYNPTGLGEQLLRSGPNGAVAYFGCHTGSQPCGVTLLEGFVNTLAKTPKPRLGDCWFGAVSYYFEHERLAQIKPNDDWYPPSIFFQGMKFMLFGDPTLPMPRSTLTPTTTRSAAGPRA